MCCNHIRSCGKVKPEQTEEKTPPGAALGPVSLCSVSLLCAGEGIRSRSTSWRVLSNSAAA